MSKGPVLFDLDDVPDGQAAPSPAEAPPVPETDLPVAPRGQAMQTLAALGARRGSRLGRWALWLVTVLLGTALSVAAWDFIRAMLARNELLGFALVIVLGLFLLVCLAIVIREAAAFARLRRVDRLHRDADAAIAAADLVAARAVLTDLNQLYAGRDDTRWGREKLAEREAEQLDADGLLGLAETTLLDPLDHAARLEVEAAARQVALVTALVPLALADVAVALTSNIRMVRRIAEIYGGRSGTLGSWRLMRAVLTHLVATGAVAMGDDMIGSLAGGNVLAKLSRRFGEGVVNGALTARVGVAAMEVCRPLPFRSAARPSVSALIGRALSGLFRGGGRDA